MSRITLDGGVTETIDDDPLFGLSNLMLGDAFLVSHDSVTHARGCLDHAEDGDELVMPGACSRLMMLIGQECVVEHDDRLMVIGHLCGDDADLVCP